MSQAENRITERDATAIFRQIDGAKICTQFRSLIATETNIGAITRDFETFMSGGTKSARILSTIIEQFVSVHDLACIPSEFEAGVRAEIDGR